MCLFTRATSTGGKQKSNHPLLPSTTLRRRRRHVTLFFLSYTTASSEVPSRHIMKRSTRRSIRPVLSSFFSPLSLSFSLSHHIFPSLSSSIFPFFSLSHSLSIYLSVYLYLSNFLYLSHIVRTVALSPASSLMHLLFYSRIGFPFCGSSRSSGRGS